MDLRNRTRARVALVAAAATLLTACGGGLGSEESSDSGPVKIGLLVPQSGVYKALGDDMKNGYELYLDQHDGKLGGREIETATADEGETADSGKAAAEKLVKQDNVMAVTGVVSSAVMNGTADLFEEGTPLVGSNASPTTLTDAKYIWRTSYVNDEPGKALGAYVAEKVDGPVYLLAADYQAGIDEVTGFKETFLAAGGKVADEVYTPFPTTTNFQPFLSNLEKSGAKAVFTFYAGGAAVDFVKQYEQFGLSDKVAHYSAGFLTEGGVLDAQAAAAEGTFTAMNYSADLDNDVNAEFVKAYEEAYDAKPTTYAMASYDAAQVLDKAIEAAGDDLTSETLNDAIAEVGEIDSPRGPWSFNDNGTPVQTWYLREVQAADGGFSNVVIEELGELG
ncbi:MAG: ABC transporter substrate-binding protein [Propionibacteriales bacterium]|nr:ABC transporter substrate-binding protein [Propionibacteriales bacterium]